MIDICWCCRCISLFIASRVPSHVFFYHDFMYVSIFECSIVSCLTLCFIHLGNLLLFIIGSSCTSKDVIYLSFMKSICSLMILMYFFRRCFLLFSIVFVDATSFSISRPHIYTIYIRVYGVHAGTCKISI